MCKVGRYISENSGMMSLPSEVQTTTASMVELIRHGCKIFKYKCDSALCKTK